MKLMPQQGDWEIERLNEALGESQRRLEESQRVAQIGHWERNLVTNCITWSDEVYRIFGLPPGKLDFHSLQLMIHPDDRPQWQRNSEAAILGLRPYEVEYRLVRPDGSIRNILSRGEVARDSVGCPLRIFGILQDITERKAAGDALRESEHRFRQLTETIEGVFWLSDVSKKDLIYVSRAYERIWGRSCDGLYRDPLSWMDAIHPEDRERVKLAATTLQVAGNYSVNYRIIRPDGEVRWINDRAFPIRNAAGKVYRIAGVANDITAQQEMEQQLRHSQKMEAVGLLAGGIAHDFNNLLAVIQLQTSLLLTAKDLPVRVKKGMQDIMDASERAATLTRQLLTFSRREVLQAKNLRLEEIVDSTMKLLRRLLGEDVTLRTHFSPGLPLIHADPGMMEQVLMNLAINARDAMPTGGCLTVTLESVKVDEARAVLHPGAAPGLFVRLAVQDTGAGIPEEHLGRVFEPFFTTKESGKGTGLGLATVFGIVEQHGGWLEVESAVGRGSSFHAYLPALQPSASAVVRTDEPPPPRGGAECILLVEDDEALLMVAQATLEHHGYRVLAVPTATEALEVWHKEKNSIDLLLTDLVMPGGMSGQELADRVAAEKAGLRIIHTSGYNDQVVSQRLRESSGGTFLRKPYSSRQLAETVRNCLDHVVG